MTMTGRARGAVGLVTCRALPEPDADRELLVDALRAAGVDARWVAWDDPTVAWQSFALVVVRSTWNYVAAFDDFLAWIDRVEGVTRLLNPGPVLRFSAHKSYLAALAERGLPVVPTHFLPRGERADLGALLERRGWAEAVVKPTVSAGSFATRRVALTDLADAEAWLAAHLEVREMMVQPYLRSMEGYGERALVWIDGELTHAVRKSPRFLDQHEQTSEALPIAPEEAALAEAALRAAPGELLYGRVDVAPGPDGRPLLMEL